MVYSDPLPPSPEADFHHPRLPKLALQAAPKLRKSQLTRSGLGRLFGFKIPANAANQLAELQSQYQNIQDGQQRKELVMWIGYHAGLVKALPTLSMCMPGITFSDRLSIHGAKLTAELITFEGAHTGSATVLYLPQRGILLMGDLLFVGCHPYLADGDPYQLLKALKECSRMEATCFVPGHGPVGTPDDLTALSNYIEYCIETAQRLNDEGGASDENLAKLIIDEQYQHWKFPQFFDSNIRFLCERMRKVGEENAYH